MYHRTKTASVMRTIYDARLANRKRVPRADESSDDDDLSGFAVAPTHDLPSMAVDDDDSRDLYGGGGPSLPETANDDSGSTGLKRVRDDDSDDDSVDYEPLAESEWVPLHECDGDPHLFDNLLDLCDGSDETDDDVDAYEPADPDALDAFGWENMYDPNAVEDPEAGDHPDDPAVKMNLHNCKYCHAFLYAWETRGKRTEETCCCGCSRLKTKMEQFQLRPLPPTLVPLYVSGDMAKESLKFNSLFAMTGLTMPSDPSIRGSNHPMYNAAYKIKGMLPLLRPHLYHHGSC